MRHNRKYGNFLQSLVEQSLLQVQQSGKKKLYTLINPSIFELPSSLFDVLFTEYDHAREKGGILGAIPELKGGRIVYRVEKALFVRNLYGPETNDLGRSERDTYRPDDTEFKMALEEIADNFLLPIFFHTHPSPADYNLLSITTQIEQFDPSDEDLAVSNIWCYGVWGDTEDTGVPGSKRYGGKS